MKINVITVGALDTNCYIISSTSPESETMIVDPGDDGDRILQAVEGMNVKCIIITHAHYDHIGAAAYLQERLDVPILIGEHDAPALGDPRRNLSRLARQTLKPPTADGLLSDNQQIQLGQKTFTVLHTPGHTKGSICLLCDDILISGDTLFFGTVGRFAYPDRDLMRHSFERLLCLDENVLVYPGHGQTTTICHERRFNDMHGSWDDL